MAKNVVTLDSVASVAPRENRICLSHASRVHAAELGDCPTCGKALEPSTETLDASALPTDELTSLSERIKVPAINSHDHGRPAVSNSRHIVRDLCTDR